LVFFGFIDSFLCAVSIRFFLMRILKGQPVADKVLSFCRACIDSSCPPGLAILRIGEDPASIVYIQRKRAIALELGIYWEEAVFEKEAPASQIEEKIDQWNQSPQIHGILLQLPLPEGHVASQYIQQISPLKDVDGLTRGSLFTPCTPLGCLLLLLAYQVPLSGSQCLVVGRSELVGKPLALLLLQENATVTIAHRQTRDLCKLARQADILCVAAGSPALITQDCVSSEAVVVDVGIHRTEGGLVGDCEKNLLVSAKTPVPGGVGPMTVACLMWNTLKAAYQGGAPSFDQLKDFLCTIP
jgi:methylenetetrahydrofolate dehydrogenase (NADP+)/methenyltetrahydrofolate cyclohydrolase